MNAAEAAPAESPPNAAPRHLGLALVVISAAQLMVVLDATIVNIALPAIQRDLHFSSANLAWIINAYALAFGGLLLFGGRTGDLFGRRRMFIFGVTLFAVSSLLGGLATNQAWLIIARAAQGIGGAVASPTALALIVGTFPEGPARNRAMGVYAAMSGAGATVGLLLGGILTDYGSWRWVLFVNAPIGALVALAAPRVLPESTGRAGRLDVPGALSVTAGMSLLVYGLAHAATSSWSAPGTVGALVAAVVLLAVFMILEARSPHALMPLRIFADRNRSGAYLVMLVTGAAVFAMFFFLTQFIQNILGYSPLKAGVAFLPVSALIAVMAGITSQLVGRIGPRAPMTLGPLVTAGGLFWMAHVTVHSTYMGLFGPMALIAVGMGMSFVPLTLIAVSGVRHEEHGLASALLNTGQQIGGSLGLAVLVTAATAVTTSRLTAAGFPSGPLTGPSPHSLPPAVMATIAHAVTAGYDRAFYIGAAMALGAFLIALVAVRVKASDVPDGAGPMAL